MHFKNYFFGKTPLFFLGALLLISSCGSYQDVHDNDGIYGSTEVSSRQLDQKVVDSEASNPSSSYYKNYFSEKANDYNYITEDEVFTNVDEYGNNYAEENDSTQVINDSYSGWGQENTNVTVNIYDTGWNSGWGWGYPYRNWGWNSGWGWGYPNYGWGWNSGLNWGYYGNSWAYCPPYYGGYYGNGFYGGYYRNSVSYTNGRRGSAYMGRSNNRYTNNNSTLGRRNSIGRRSKATRYNEGRPRAQSSTTKPKTRTTTRSIRNEGRPAVRPGTTTTTNSKPRTRTRTNTTTRTTRPTRSYNNSSTPSRSYSSPSRSGGSSMGGGRSSGGRGGRGGL